MEPQFQNQCSAPAYLSQALVMVQYLRNTHVINVAIWHTLKTPTSPRFVWTLCGWSSTAVGACTRSPGMWVSSRARSLVGARAISAPDGCAYRRGRRDRRGMSDTWCLTSYE